MVEYLPVCPIYFPIPERFQVSFRNFHRRVSQPTADHSHGRLLMKGNRGPRVTRGV